MSSSLPDDLALRVTGVSKEFRLPQERVHTLKERILHPTRGRRAERLEALDGISLDIRRGEFFGIVGRNGSGKSTLMKCLAGVYRPDAGEILARGRIAPFIELGVGFNPELTARDNVMINGVMLGLSQAEVRARYDSIIAFAELEEFQELALKNFSSGMQVRLAFSVMVHVDADVLLIDEVLAVGDAAFQQKCHDALSAAREDGRTVLLVTHEMAQVERFCDRALLLERGRAVTIGDSRTVARRYMQMNFAPTRESVVAAEIPQGAEGDGAAVILGAWMQDGTGRRHVAVDQGDPCAALMRLRFTRSVENPVFGFTISDDQQRRLISTNTERDGQPTGSYAEGDEVDVWMSFDNWLVPGRYFLSPHVAYPGGAGRLMGRAEDMSSFLVTGSHHEGGVVDVPRAFGWRTRQPGAQVTT